MRDLANKVFAADDVDLSVASNDCERCHGTGVVGDVAPTSSMRAGGVRSNVPLVCRCVVRNGGVRRRPMSPMTAIIANANNNTELRVALRRFLGMPRSVLTRIATLTALESISYYLDHDKGEVIREVIAEERKNVT